MTSPDEMVCGTLTFDSLSGEGMVYVKADLFLVNDVNRIDLVQDWVVYLEGILETMRQASQFQEQEPRQQTQTEGAKK